MIYSNPSTNIGKRFDISNKKDKKVLNLRKKALKQFL
jgi:hypothetical protein